MTRHGAGQLDERGVEEVGAVVARVNVEGDCGHAPSGGAGQVVTAHDHVDIGRAAILEAAGGGEHPAVAHQRPVAEAAPPGVGGVPVHQGGDEGVLPRGIHLGGADETRRRADAGGRRGRGEGEEKGQGDGEGEA